MRTLRNVFYRQPRAPGQPLPCSRVSEDGQAGRDQAHRRLGRGDTGLRRCLRHGGLRLLVRRRVPRRKHRAAKRVAADDAPDRFRHQPGLSASEPGPAPPTGRPTPTSGRPSGAALRLATADPFSQQGTPARRTPAGQRPQAKTRLHTSWSRRGLCVSGRGPRPGCSARTASASPPGAGRRRDAHYSA